MASSLLFLEYDELQLNPDEIVVTGGYYAIIHDLYGKAVSNLTTPYPLIDFAAASQSDFAFGLQEDAERTRHWQSNVSCTLLDLPSNPYGEWYEYEVYGAQVSGTYDRSLDKLVKVERFTWVQRMAQARLDVTQEQSIAVLSGIANYLTQKTPATDAVAGSWGKYLADLQAGVTNGVLDQLNPQVSAIIERTQHIPDDFAQAQWSANVNAAYDSENQRIQFLAWLEKDGQLYHLVAKCALQVFNSSAVEVLSISYEPPIESIPATSQFNFSQAPIILTPDETYYAVVTITPIVPGTEDSDTPTEDTPRTSAAALITWD